jgi:hypothetical protein
MSGESKYVRRINTPAPNAVSAASSSVWDAVVRDGCVGTIGQPTRGLPRDPPGRAEPTRASRRFGASPAGCESRHELDRATVPTDTLAGKLARYADLYRHAPASRGQPTGKPPWKARYPIFPDIICVLAGQSRAILARRAQTVLALCQEDPRLQITPEVRVSLALLEDLQGDGRFAAIWRQPTNPARALDWLGSRAPRGST